MSYNAVMTDKGRRALWSFLKKRRCLYVCDESAYIKSPSAMRTKRIVASGEYAPFKRILTGTPVANSPFDVYSQVRFLDLLFWRQHSIGSSQIFRHTFGEMVQFIDANGRTQEFAKGYRNLDQLRDWLQPIASRVLKDDVLDLPPKLFTKRYFELTGEQRRVYNDLKKEFEVELNNGEITTAPLVIQRVTRFQQITSGYLPSDDGVFYRFDRNPRLGLAEEFRDECSTQAIVWAQRNEDIDQLLGVFGDSAVRHDGQCSDAQREYAKKAFRAGEKKWFIAKPSTGGVGLTLTEAKNMMYYNTGYNLGERQQSEDRFHRIGQDSAVTIQDCAALNTIDEGIIEALRNKFNVGAQVTGDQVREWL
jgi:SNF2 family DNA or RNA helicase